MEKNVRLQSTVIDILRFPLTIMVIFIHMNPKVINLLDSDIELLSGKGIYNIVGISFSHVLPTVAVPSFFLISGYLFFLNFQHWSWERYKRKLQSRVQTLFVPYILWNALPFLFAIVTVLASVILNKLPIEVMQDFVQDNGWHIFYDCSEWDSLCVNWLGESVAMKGPYDLPLWFLRDLIFITLLSPIIYISIRRLGLSVIIFLFCAYISRVWTSVPGFSIIGIFYFSLGAYFALKGVSMIECARRYRYVFIPLCVVFFIIDVVYDGTNTVIGQNIHPFFMFTGVFTLFYLTSVCVKKYNIQPNKLLVSSCFFIYALHVVKLSTRGTLLSLVQIVLHSICPGQTVGEDIICYMISPFVTVLLCIAILIVFKRVFPKFFILCTGSRF